MQKQLHIGDTVSVLDENLKGKVVLITGDSILILDTDGFERTYFANELVVYNKNPFVKETIESKEIVKQVSVRNSNNQWIQLGDLVGILNEKIKGKVTKINGDHVTIEEANGFESAFSINNVIVYDTVLLSDQTKTPKKVSDKKPLIKQEIVSSSIVDLHNTNNYLDKNRILENQIRIFKDELNFAIGKNQTQIIFIHGKGQGILRNEIEKILHKEGITYKKAPYRKFGQGAIQVLLYGINQVIR